MVSKWCFLQKYMTNIYACFALPQHYLSTFVFGLLYIESTMVVPTIAIFQVLQPRLWKEGNIIVKMSFLLINIVRFFRLLKGLFEGSTRKRKYGAFYMIEHQLLTVQAVYWSILCACLLPVSNFSCRFLNPNTFLN